MRRSLGLVVVLALAAAGCANEASTPRAEGAFQQPALTPEGMPVAFCDHLIKDFEPLFDAGVDVGVVASDRWSSLSAGLTDDIVVLEQLPGVDFVAETRALATSARELAGALGGAGSRTDPSVERAWADMESSVRLLVMALPDDACVDHDRGAQATLRNALAAALTAYTDAQSFDRVGPEQIGPIEPSLDFVGDVTATTGAVSINLAKGDSIVMSVMSGTGRPFCIGHEADRTVYGTVDAVGARSLDDCGDSPAWPA